MDKQTHQTYNTFLTSMVHKNISFTYNKNCIMYVHIFDLNVTNLELIMIIKSEM